MAFRALFVCCCLAASAAAEDPDVGLDLHLEGALIRAAGEDPGKRLVVYLEPDPEGGFVEEFVGWSAEVGPWVRPDKDGSRYYARVDCHGTIMAQERDGEAWTLELCVVQPPDPYVPDSAGEGRYTVTLAAAADGAYHGHFAGDFAGRAAEGPVEGHRDRRLWPRRLADHVPPEPGEHPRLLFRRDDLPELREQAATPRGRAILARLRTMLGVGGENGDRPSTLWDGAGFGFLYQITEDKVHADRARAAVERALAGERDRDRRYAFVKAGGRLRKGPSVAAIAMAYDLCYDAWDEEFRREVAARIAVAVWGGMRGDPDALARAESVNGDLLFEPGRGQLMPHSNHYGAWNGGGGLATLAIRGDPGVDAAEAELAHRVFVRRALRALEVGFGETAWFFEGHHGGRLSTNSALTAYLHALRVADGRDAVTVHPAGRWLTAKWLFETVRDGRGRLLATERGIYAHKTFRRGGSISKSGDFAQGLAIAPPDLAPALAWYHARVIAPDRRDFDAVTYPQPAIFALLARPDEEVHPGEVLPRHLHDVRHHYLALRSGWRDDGRDVACTFRAGRGMWIGEGIAADPGFRVPPGVAATAVGEDAILFAGEDATAAVCWDAGPPLLLVEARSALVAGGGKRPPFARDRREVRERDETAGGIREVVRAVGDHRVRLLGPAGEDWPEIAVEDGVLVFGPYRFDPREGTLTAVRAALPADAAAASHSIDIPRPDEREFVRDLVGILTVAIRGDGLAATLAGGVERAGDEFAAKLPRADGNENEFDDVVVELSAS